MFADNDLINKTYTLPLNYSSIDSCLYKPCENDGECIKNINDEIKEKNQTDLSFINPIQLDTYRCVCKNGWFGVFCHLRICDLKPCSPNGQCVQNEDLTNYTCHCFIGFKGRHCTDTVATCDRGQNPCNNRGDCILRNGIATCKCFKFYEGNNYTKIFKLTSNKNE